MKNFHQSPTEKQIHLVEKITSVLEIDFPCCSAEFTKSIYRQFISAYLEDFKREVKGNKYSDELYALCENDIWCEFY